MTVRDLIRQEIDVDVYDDVCEELAIAFCGPLELTAEGEKEFSEVLDYPVLLHDAGGCMIGIIRIDDPDNAVWEARLEKAKRFFCGAAGYCACSDYDRWFKESQT